MWNQWRQQRLERAYPLLETRDYIQRETSKPNSVFVWRGKTENPRKIIGFAWGYSLDTIDRLTKDKWSLASPSDQKQLSSVMRSAVSGEPFWYFSEIGVLSKYRQKGLAMILAKELVEQSPIDQDVLVRTNANSPLTIILSRLGFNQILGPRTIVSEFGLSADWQDTVNMLDPINPDRVVYALSKERRSR